MTEHLTKPRRRRPLADRFWAKVEVPIQAGGCWEWTGAKDKLGYGRIGTGGHTGTMLAHRASYELHMRAIPSGLELDHMMCRNSSCVSPLHLEPVTRSENLRRGRNWQREKTHCPQGHPLIGANLMIDAYSGSRRCLECFRRIGRDRQRRYRLRKKAR